MNRQEIKRLRRHLAISQRTLAGFLGVATNTVSRWEEGVNPIPQWAVNFMSHIALPTDPQVSPRDNSEALVARDKSS